ncbi:MAG: hypothetical protein AB1637_04650 [Elusimicrobiota bacterium]
MIKKMYKKRLLYGVKDLNLEYEIFLKDFKTENENLCYIFSDFKIKEDLIFANKIDLKKYRVRFYYDISKENFISRSKIKLLPENINIFRFDSDIEYKNFFICLENLYYNDWINYLPVNYMSTVKEFIESQSVSNYLCLTKSDTKVAFVSLNEYYGTVVGDMDWISHIWISRDLQKEERRLVREYVIYWLSINMKLSHLKGAVDAFNVRSQNFFKKIGFNIECVQFSKLKF